LGLDSEALIVATDEIRQELVGLFDSRDSGEAQFEGKAVLEGLPQAFDASFGLRGAGVDMVDAELLESSSELAEG